MKKIRLWCVAVSIIGFLGSAFAQVPPSVNILNERRQVISLGASLTLTATSSADTSLQWRRNGRPIAGATNQSLQINNASLAKDAGWYQVIATNASGIVRSDPVFVNVICSSEHRFGWGSNSWGQKNFPSQVATFSQLAAGATHSVGLAADGKVYSWGGYSGKGLADTPVNAVDVVGIAAGGYHSLALKADGTVLAWGSNLNNKTTVPSGLQNVVQVAAGGGGWNAEENSGHCIVLKADGTLVAWGTDLDSQASIPTGLSGVAMIAAGGGHNVALRENGSVIAWGRNNAGQCNVPAGLSNVVSVAAGSDHSAALRADGTLFIWGNGGTFDSSPRRDFVAVSANWDQTFALTGDGGLWAKGGGNAFGQLGGNFDGFGQFYMVSPGTIATLALRDKAGDRSISVSAQPVSRSISIGDSLSLKVQASAGTAPMKFQWRKDGVNIYGATNDTYAIEKVSDLDAASYSFSITTYADSYQSTPFSLTLATAAAPFVVSPPKDVTIATGGQARLTVQVTGSGPFSYQWYQGQSGDTSKAISGATLPEVVTPTLSTTDGFWVKITDSRGVTANSPAATVTVTSTPTISVSQSLMGTGYASGGAVVITNVITYAGAAPSRIDWATLLPLGWKYLGSGGSEGSGPKPAYESGDLVEWSWTTVPTSPIKFTYVVGVPSGTVGDQVIASIVTSQQIGTTYQAMAKPDPLIIKSASNHSADTNRDFKISLTELTRVIELYNYRSGTTRTGQYKIQSNTEDGFSPGP